MSDLLRARTGIDAVLTKVAYSLYQAETLIPFIAPAVTVASRIGKIITFGAEQFAVTSTKRTPYANHKKTRASGYDTSKAFVLEQHSKTAEVSWEEIDEAEKGALNIDLKELAILDAVREIEQSLEQELYDLVANPASFEVGNRFIAAGTDQFSNLGSDPEAYVINIKSIVRLCIGRYPTRAVISDDVYRALVLHPIFRDRNKYTTTSSTDLEQLAHWFGLPGGIKVANRLKYNPVTQETEDMFPQGTMLLFVDARDERQALASLQDENAFSMFEPLPGIYQGTATFAQLYVVGEGLTVGRERIEEDNDTVQHTVRFTGGVVLPSVGATGLSAAGALISNLV